MAPPQGPTTPTTLTSPSRDYGKENGLAKKKAAEKKDATTLAQQYGGKHVGGWISHLPESWVPFIQLARISPPVALLLIYLPHLFGALLAVLLQSNYSLPLLAQHAALLLLGSLLFSNAAHAWNDLIDAPLDAAVARTRTRPIPRGAVTPLGAFLFAATQAVGAAAILPFLSFPGGFLGAVRIVVPNIVATTYYPWAKRHTHFAQLVLGFCLAHGVYVGCAAMGVNPWSFVIGEAQRTGVQDPAATVSISLPNMPALSLHFSVAPTALFLACLCWTAVYDTLYAHQDLPDDQRLGLKSLAVLLQPLGMVKPVLLSLSVVAGSILVLCGIAGGFTAGPFLAVAPTGVILSLAIMVMRVDLKSSGSCWWWFRYGFWAVAAAVVGGLVGEWVAREAGFVLLQKYCEGMGAL
jgi:4-hydroxybenzoate polyprenyltransferase